MERNYDRSSAQGLTVPADRPLIGLLTEEEGQQVVRYFAGDGDADAEAGLDEPLRAALAVIGAWSDLDWDEFSSELDQIRHASPPTPPIDLQCPMRRFLIDTTPLSALLANRPEIVSL